MLPKNMPATAVPCFVAREMSFKKIGELHVSVDFKHCCHYTCSEANIAHNEPVSAGCVNCTRGLTLLANYITSRVYKTSRKVSRKFCPELPKLS